jgi:hypothetical protein
MTGDGVGEAGVVGVGGGTRATSTSDLVGRGMGVGAGVVLQAAIAHPDVSRIKAATTLDLR